MRPVAYKTRIFFFALATLIFLALIPVVVLYALGYRITQYTDGFKLSVTGGAFVSYPKSGAQIYVNDELYGETSLFRRSLFIENLKAGSYQLKVTYPEFRDWTKQILVENQQVVEAYPYLVREIIATTSVPQFLTEADVVAGKKNPQYIKVASLFAVDSEGVKLATTTAKTKSATSTTVVVPPVPGTISVSSPTSTLATTTPDFKVLAKQGNVSIVKTGTSTFTAIEAWYNGDKDNAPSSFCVESKCSTKITLISRAAKITDGQFFFGRSDVMLYSDVEGIYSMEFDPRLPRNVFKLVSGTNLEFRMYDDKTLAIHDKTKDYYYLATVL